MNMNAIYIFPTFGHIDASWWPNTEINITEMMYPNTFHDLLQDCNSLCKLSTGTMKLGKLANSVIFHKQRWPPVGHLEADQPNFLWADVTWVDTLSYQISSRLGN